MSFHLSDDRVAAQHVLHHLVWNLNFYRSHGIRSDVVYVIIEGNAVFVEVEVLCRGDISGRTVAHIFKCFMGRDFFVCHQLVP